MKTMYRRILQRGIFLLLTIIIVLSIAGPVTARSERSSAYVTAIDAFVRAQVERHGIPGLALALVDGDQIVHAQGYGTADQTGRAVTPQTPFVLASVSKPLTALAVMQLVEAGTLELDAPVQRYLPDFRVADPVASGQITLRHLLLHTSGIPVTACDTRAGAETLEQFVTELRTVALDTAPGTHRNYCSGNFNVLGRVIEVVSGSSFGAYMQQHVFAPLDMRHSHVSEQEAQQDGLAQGYQWLFGVPVATHYPYNPSQLPSGYLISSAEDMGHFVIAQLNGGRFGSASVLSPDGIAAMHTPAVAVGAGEDTYGMGWNIGPLGGVPAIHHDGVNFEFHSLVFIEPQTRRGAVLLVNSFGIVPYVSAFKEIEQGVARLLAELEPAPASMSLRMLYLAINAPLLISLVLALWPLVRLRHWYQRLREQQMIGRTRLSRVSLRIAWELGMPIVLLAGVRLVLHRMGAQSWAEGIAVYPDLGIWLWTFALLVLVTGTIRLLLVLRLLRHGGPAGSSGHPSIASIAVER